MFFLYVHFATLCDVKALVVFKQLEKKDGEVQLTERVCMRVVKACELNVILFELEDAKTKQKPEDL